MNEFVVRSDEKLIRFFKKIWEPISRLSLFVVFFWFGLLKVLGESPAGPLVNKLYDESMFAGLVGFGKFIVLFGLFECLIGVLFIIKGMERTVLPLLLIHLVTTMGPLLLLPETTWSKALVPTLEGQYIIKNLAIISVAIGIAASLHPLNPKRSS
jgi:uncharacterized membrane protein YkgB